ncbi:MAG: hypothetical protein ACYC6C_05205 [Coriobacteriia bacterium]
MQLISDEISDAPQPIGSSIIVWALAGGASFGVIAKLLGSVPGPLVLLGVGVAFWVSAGFVFARIAARHREMLDAMVWAGTTVAVYLGSWLLAYCFVFGLQQSSGFGAAWLDERLFFILAPGASAVIGVIAAISLRTDWIGDAFLAAPIAWSLPEVWFSFQQGWQFVVAVALPVVVLALIPLASERHRRVSGTVFTGACIAGGLVGFLLIHAIDGRF